MPENTEFLAFAIEVAQEAGHIIMGFYEQKMSRDWKSRSDFKTAADDASDAYICSQIRATFPDHNVWSEESGQQNRGCRYTWVWDAVDGTIPMFHVISDHFSVCGALCDGTTPIVGVGNAVKRGEMYTARVGTGAYCNGVPIRVSTETEIAHVVFGIDSGKQDREGHIPFLQRAYRPDGTVIALSSGCASVPLFLVASGKLHAYIGTALGPEDMAAAVPIIREAGGRVTNLKGEEWELGDTSILAANPTLHAKLGEFFEIF